MRESCRPAVSVEIEGRPRLYAPRHQRIMSEIRLLTPKGGPSFLIIGSSGRDYLQIAGGDGAYVLERREYDDRDFRHFAAARPGCPASTWIDISTNGGHITVRANEKLKLKDVQALATDFIEGRGRSDQFLWRDMTANFD